MVGFTWPTKDDELSSDTERKLGSLSRQNRDRSSESMERQEDKVTSVPLRTVLFPTEDELSLSQMTPSSSLRAFDVNPNASSRRSLGDEDNSLANLQEDEMWQQRRSDARREDEDPPWPNQHSKVSFYVSQQSLPSPPRSPPCEGKHLPGECSGDNDTSWQSFGDESHLALCTDDMDSELERLEVRHHRYC